MAIRLKHWLSQFCGWHELHKKGELASDLRQTYFEARADLCTTLVLAQRIEIHASGTRQSLRMARAMQVELGLNGKKVSALTQDISVSGLSTLVGDAPAVGTQINFKLKLGRDIEPVVGIGRVVAAIPAQGSVRMAVSFDEIDAEARMRIEDMVLDAICAEMRTACLRNGSG
jgi:hypothetical protein